MGFLGAKITGIKAKEFNILRRTFFPKVATCYLLKIDGGMRAFAPELELTNGWYLEYSKFRGRFELYYASSDPEFARRLSLSSHVAVSGEVYTIDRSESVPPQGEEPFWRIACTRTGERFEDD